MYRWLKPRIAVPVHGEAMHLAAHADLARSLGVPTVFTIADGTMIRLAPSPGEVDEVEAGRLYKDGMLIGDLESVGATDRRRLGFAGIAAISVVLDRNGEIEADPGIALIGLPRVDAAGRPMQETVMNAVLGALDSLPRARRRDRDVVREAVCRAVRAAVNELWGKKPNCTVLVTVL